MIIVNATINPKENKKENIIQKAEALIKASRNHEGNISYNLYADSETDTLLFAEKWETKESLQKHMETEEFLAFGQETKDLIDGELEVEVYLAQLVSDNS